jgi:hypothetical protein
MPMVHIISKSYQDPRFEDETVNRFRVFENDPEKALAAVKLAAKSFERVELAWSETVTESEYQFVRSLR